MRSREFAWLQYRDENIDEMQWRQEAMVIQAIFGNRRQSAPGGNQLVVKYSPPSLLHLWMSHIRDSPGIDPSGLASWSNR